MGDVTHPIPFCVRIDKPEQYARNRYMGCSSITGGIRPAGTDRIQFDLRINGRRLRPTLPWPPTDANLQRAREHIKTLKDRIAAGTFRLAEEFPDYVRRHMTECLNTSRKPRRPRP